MDQDFLLEAKNKMKQALTNLENRLINIRAGRANPAMFDSVMVSYYGTPTQLKQLATLAVPEARQIMIKPYDKTLLSDIEKAIYEANLGVTPNNNGEVVFINIPPLTEERRKELVKQAKEYIEDGRIAIRNVRQDIIKDIKAAEVSEDIEKGLIDRLQDIVNDTNKQVEEIYKEKEKELMEI